MKKLLFGLGALAMFFTLESCSKCGQCVITQSQGTLTQKNTGDVSCGNDNNESGSYYKAAQKQCEQYPTRYKEQNPGSTITVTTEWVNVK